jgi:hypothetical protein
LDGPLPKWCPAVALSRQDGHHSAIALLLKAALIQVSNYRLLGASGFVCMVRNCEWMKNEKKHFSEIHLLHLNSKISLKIGKEYQIQ